MKKQYIDIKSIGLLTLVLFSIMIASSCKTEYENIMRPYNAIERFTVAGYGDVDSLDAVITEGQITIYWNPQAERPEKIAPKIKISEGAKISPASGTEVSFTETTKFTVTAEDGSTKVYTLKPVFNIPVPSLFSVPTYYSWSSATPISIGGQYFFSTGNVKDIKVYMQRVRDGFEFDIPFDEATATTNLLKATLPKMTSELDTGAHRLYVKVGGFKSSVADVFLGQPLIKDMITSTTFDRIGNLPIGSELIFKMNIKDEWLDAYKRFYAMNQVSWVTLGLQQIVPGSTINGQAIEIDAKYYNIGQDGTVKFTISPDFFNAYKHYRLFSFNIMYGGNFTTGYGPGFASTGLTIPSPLVNGLLETIIEETKYASYEFSHEGKQIKLGEQLTIDYTFDNPAHATTYTTLAAVNLGLKDATTGVYTTYTLPTANRTMVGNRISFTIPTTATAVLNKQVVMISATFRGTPLNNTIQPRKQLSNTSVVSN